MRNISNEPYRRSRPASWKRVARSYVLRGASLTLTSAVLHPVAELAREMSAAASAIPKRCARAVIGGWKGFPTLLRSVRKPPGNTRRGWIGVDLDGTLAQYRGWKGVDKIGPPVPLMLERVKAWLDDGVDVRIFTARVSRRAHRRIATRAIGDWCEQHGLPRLPVTNAKDYQMIELWDDRAVRVEINVGRRVDERAQRRGRHARPLKPNPLASASGLLAPYSKAKQKVPGATKLPGIPQ